MGGCVDRWRYMEERVGVTEGEGGVRGKIVMPGRGRRGARMGMDVATARLRGKCPRRLCICVGMPITVGRKGCAAYL
jgi:hypothetical protein